VCNAWFIPPDGFKEKGPYWRRYERQIEAELRKIAPKATITFDTKLPGRYSQTNRQVDVLVEGEFRGYGPTRMVVDCKFFRSNLSVTGADTFVGYMDDLHVELGLLVTTKGFSESAQRRLTAAKGLKWRIIPFEEIENWEPPLATCDICASVRGPEVPPGVIHFRPPAPEVEGAALVTGVGRCDRCAAVHVECTCGAVTGFHEAEADTWRECDGGCGVGIRVADVELDDDYVPTNLDLRTRVSFRRRLDHPDGALDF
jgi:hypothetical protein